MRNSLYLKRYVQMHPDNKMGWYLLGKEYEKEGQQGKANYCFNKAGSIYEAFETSKMPSDILKEYESKLIQQAHEKEQRSLWTRRTLIVFMLLMLALVPSVDAPGQHMKAQSALNSKQPEGKIPKNRSDNALDRGHSSTPDENVVLFTAAQEGGFGTGGFEFKPGPFAKPEQLRSKLAVLEMKKQGNWLMWNRRMPIGYTLENNAPGAVTYQSYNPKVCNCQPLDAGKLANDALAWTGVQEEQALLYSAIKAYKNNSGRFPDKLADLLRPFPGNWISGTTDGMKDDFQPMLERVKAEESGQPVNTAEGTAGKGPFSGTWGGKPFFGEPLKIIVDKSNHRLAVVSGRIILRNYKVGLGGERTPEGRYVITDKVINPNGHSDGEFGSRGMQLSGTNYAIHGTNEQSSVGEDESQGCIRMSKTDVEELFDMVPMGTPVIISKGVLPDELIAPKERFQTKREQDQDQTNPQKTYHWL
ncbi:L,D-transpeptidase [Paenibacillus sp.]|uniref:L,D-transpeptidase n=1 Tax=Paenibacillus sp. TaxID=58172 RepID=UPI00282F974A|nr:L,D-transpeptidase [Paenibacillus sp.]MDR0270640.1 L,D-transpeptidase [Paenibacillus sp.]